MLTVFFDPLYGATFFCHPRCPFWRGLTVFIFHALSYCFKQVIISINLRAGYPLHSYNNLALRARSLLFFKKVSELRRYKSFTLRSTYWIPCFQSSCQVLIFFGTYAYQPNWLDLAYSGAPLGEMVQWSDLLASLYILGHDLTLAVNSTTYKR